MKNITLLSIQAAILSFVLLVSTSQAADSTVNYDTAWTYVYDGGSNLDVLYDVKVLPNGTNVCVGESADTSTGTTNTVLIKLDASGHELQKKLFNTNNPQNARYNSQYARSLVIAKNGDFIMGGVRYIGPLIMRTDSAGNLKWATWYYDSTRGVLGSLLQGNGTVNCVRETSRGTIICAAGDYFTDAGYVYGSTKNNFAAYFEFDSTGKKLHGGQLNNTSGYNIGGFSIEESPTGSYIIVGNQTINYVDTSSNTIWQNSYSFSLNGVGTEVNNITRCKKLKNGTLIVAGQAYEGNCWIKYSHLFYDAWWSPITLAADGMNATWDTAGFEGGDDRINDFTQLANGNLVFVGKANYSNASTSGIWVYVTPDTGSHILWQGIIAGSLYAGEPLSVCATQDTGFTVVGKIGGNAFAAHFAPGPLSGVKYSRSATPSAQLSARIVGRRLVVTNAMPNTMASVSLYDVSGKRVAMQAGQKEISFDISQLSHGMYLVKMRTDSGIQTAKIVVRRDKGNQALICHRFLSSLALV